MILIHHCRHMFFFLSSGTIDLGSPVVDFAPSQDGGFVGAVSDLYVWDRALTENETDHLIANDSPPPSGWVLGWAGFRLMGDVVYAQSLPLADRKLVCPHGLKVGTNVSPWRCDTPHPGESRRSSINFDRFFKKFCLSRLLFCWWGDTALSDRLHVLLREKYSQLSIIRHLRHQTNSGG